MGSKAFRITLGWEGVRGKINSIITGGRQVPAVQAIPHHLSAGGPPKRNPDVCRCVYSAAVSYMFVYGHASRNDVVGLHTS